MVDLPGHPWVRPVPDGYEFICCSCGLVHAMNFRVGSDGLPEFQIEVDEEATARERAEQGEHGRAA